MDLIGIGLRIKHCRKQERLTQEELAEILNLSPHYIYEIERGSKTMSLQTLERILDTLNISADYLLFGIECADRAGAHTDRLSMLIKELPPHTRENLADIVMVLLPRLK